MKTVFIAASLVICLFTISACTEKVNTPPVLNAAQDAPAVSVPKLISAGYDGAPQWNPDNQRYEFKIVVHFAPSASRLYFDLSCT